MSELLHPRQHPDADQLSAFAEHVLPEHERLETLAHLAECPECRQIVFLAQGAQEEATFVAPAPPGRAGWLRSLPYLWPAAAAVACGLLIFAFQQRRRPMDAPQRPTLVLESRSAMPLSTAQLPQPIAPAAPLPSAKPSSTAKAGSPLRPPSVTPRASAGIGSVNGNLSAAGHASNLSVLDRNATTIDQKSTASLSPESGPVGGVFGASVGRGAPSQVLSENLLTARQGPATASKTHNQLPPQRAAPPHALSDSVHGEIQQSASQTVSVESAPAPPVLQTENGVLSVSSLSGKSAQAKSVEAPLPSNRPAASTISNGVETLAVDSAGDLFVSKDADIGWQHVVRQWTGKVVRVSLASPTAPIQPARSTSQSVDARSSKNVEAVKPTTAAKRVGFDLVTDSGTIWSSPDGFVWKQR